MVKVKKVKKVTPVMIEVELKEWKEMYEEICNLMNVPVSYSEEPLNMANETIRKIKKRLDLLAGKMWNKVNGNFRE